jgi:L-lactate dehydrogenase complex protein LldG
MINTGSKQEILSRIRNAKRQNFPLELELPDLSSAIYKEIIPDALACFKAELESVAGNCILCHSENQLADALREVLTDCNGEKIFCKDTEIAQFLKKNNIPFSTQTADFNTMQVGITACEFLVARTGSVVVSSHGESGRQMTIFPPIHLVLAKKNQLVNYVEDALLGLQKKYANSMPGLVSFISGPSRTADIEKTLVLGAHGPKKLHVFIYE